MRVNKAYLTIYSSTGAALSSMILLSRWITGNTFLFAPEAILHYGFFSGPAYSLIGMFGFFSLAILARKVKFQHHGVNSLNDFLLHKFNPLGYRLTFMMLLLTSVMGLYMQAIAGGIIFYATFQWPIAYGSTVFVVLAMILAYNNHHQLNIRHHIYKVAIVFSLLVVLMVYFFILKGIEHIYDGVRLYHPYMLVMNNRDLPLVFLAVFFVLFGQLLLDTITWTQLFRTEKSKLNRTFFLTGMVWAAVPLSFSNLVFVVIYSGGFNNISTILYDLLHELTSSFLFTFVFFFTIGIFLSTFLIQVEGIVHLFTSKEKTNAIIGNHPIFLWGSIIPIFFILTYYFQPTILPLYLFFGIIYASSLFPFLWVIYTKRTENQIIPIIWIISLVCGYIANIYYHAITSILISVMVSAILLMLTYMFRNLVKRADNCENR